MKSFLCFAAGMVVGAVVVGSAVAQNQTGRVATGVNHVGMVVEHYEEAMKFYTEAVGLREAYTVKNPDGSPLLTYLQLNRETFVELIPARAGQATGVTHYGMEVGDIDAMVARLREHGYEVADPGVTPANARYFRVWDPNDIEIEVMEYGPESLQRKAMESWAEWEKGTRE